MASGDPDFTYAGRHVHEVTSGEGSGALRRSVYMVDYGSGCLLPMMGLHVARVTLPVEIAPGVFELVPIDVYGVLPQCPNPGSGEEDLDMVHPECNPPYGISKRLTVHFSGLPPECSADPCPTISIFYDEGNDWWEGTLTLAAGSVTVRLKACTFTTDPDTGEEYPIFAYCLVGCGGSGAEDSACGSGTLSANEIGITCPTPLVMSGGPLVLGESPPCCNPYDGIVQVTARVRGFSPPYFAARHVHTVTSSGAKKDVYMPFSTCSGEDPCGFPVDCCPGKLVPANLTLQIIGSCIAGSWTLSYNPSGPYWVGTVQGCVHADTIVRARCLFDGTNWVWSVFGTSFPFCGFGGIQSVYECDPLEVDFGIVAVTGCVALPTTQNAHMILMGS